MSRGPAALLARVALVMFVVLWFVFLLAPIVVTLIASFNSAPYLIFPPPSLSLTWYARVLELDWFWTTLLNSLLVALLATLISIVLGTIAARTLSRYRFPGRAAFELLVLSPLIIPAVVLGFALLNFVLLIGTERQPLANLVAGHVLVTLPFTLRAIWSSMAGLDISLEEAAHSLGATPWTSFWQITLPTILPGIFAGSILAFAYSFNDVTVAVFLVARETTTLPVELMSHIEYSPDPTPAAVSSIMIGLTLVFFILIERLVGLEVFAQR